MRHAGVVASKAKLVKITITIVWIDKYMNIKYGRVPPWYGKGALKGLGIIPHILMEIYYDTWDMPVRWKVWQKM
jgi:hypothetical protein